MKLSAGALIIIALLPIYLIRFSVGPVPTTTLEILILAFIVFSIAKTRGCIFSAPNERNEWLIYIGAALFLIGGFLGLLVTDDILSTLGILKSYFVEPILFALVLRHILKGNERELFLKWLPVALMIPTIAISAAAIFQYATGLWIPSAWSAERRVTGPFPYPNALGHFVAPILVFLFSSFILRNKVTKVSGRTLLLPAIFYTTLAIGTVAVFLSKTEAAWIAIAITMFLTILVYVFKNKKMLAQVFVVAIGIIAAVSVFTLPSMREKILLEDWSGKTRLAVWEETWALATSSQKTMLLGVGANNYPNAVLPFHTHTYLEIFQYPHQLFLNIWSESGLLGLLGFLILASALVSRGFSQIISPSSLPYFLPPFLSLLIMSIHGLVDVPYFKNDLAILTWLFIILAMNLENERHLQPNRTSPLPDAL